jgi:hypothetical protein
MGYCKRSETASFQQASVSRITGISIDAAIAMIRAKIQERLESGPSGLRRAFQFFDDDGSGAIDIDELGLALKMKTMLVFEPSILEGVYSRFDSDGTGISYEKFCVFVMGSGSEDTTSVGDSKLGGFVGLDSDKLMQAVHRLVGTARLYSLGTARGYTHSRFCRHPCQPLYCVRRCGRSRPGRSCGRGSGTWILTVQAGARRMS